MELNWNKYGIDTSKLRGGKMVCPKCSDNRKSKKDPCLSVDAERGLFNCHHCDFKGSAAEYEPKKEYSKPLPRLEKLSIKTLAWFENTRKISNNTLLRFGVTETNEWMPQISEETTCICFNYYRDNDVVNIKFRDATKGFKMAKGAELIFYNLDAIKNETACIIVEGEIDCLTLHECGIYNSISVPNGANKGNQKLEYLDNCYKYFEGMNKIILAVDNDEAGTSLRNELARRLGKERCFTVTYQEGCKDLNEVLVKYGKAAVVEVIDSALEIPLEGIVTMDEMFPTLQSWYQDGYPKGADCKIQNFNKLLSFAPGQLTVITGIPGHGKDEFTNWIMANLAKHEEWVWGVCGFEETPIQTTTKLVEKFTGKAFDFRKDANDRVNIEELEDGIGMVDKYFKFINTEEVDTDIDGVLSKAVEMVKRYGIKGFCLNPWNWVETNRPSFMSETEFISQSLTKIVSFAKKYQVHFFLLAHTTKIQKGIDGKYPVPNLYSISGSANFFNKTHNGVTIYRDYDTNNVDVYVQKVKQSWLGQLGFCSFSYNTMTRQYNGIAARR
jgi:twinkle protein